MEEREHGWMNIYDDVDDDDGNAKWIRNGIRWNGRDSWWASSKRIRECIKQNGISTYILYQQKAEVINWKNINECDAINQSRRKAISNKFYCVDFRFAICANTHASSFIVQSFSSLAFVKRIQFGRSSAIKPSMTNDTIFCSDFGSRFSWYFWKNTKNWK